MCVHVQPPTTSSISPASPLHLPSISLTLASCRYTFNRTADYELVREMKEKVCYVGYEACMRACVYIYYAWQVCYVGYDLELEKKLALETTTVMQARL